MENANITESAATPKRKLRWYQFSLRSLLIFVTLFGIGCSWLTAKIQQAKRQKEAVDAILKSHGRVQYDYEFMFTADKEDAPWPFSYYHSDIRPATVPGPEWLRNWLGVDFLSKVVHVHIDNDASLEPLKKLPDVQALSVGFPMVLRSIAPISSLMRNENSPMPDPKWENLKYLPQLKDLSLNGSDISDEELNCLQDLNQLEYLDLSYTSITGKGLAHLKNSRKLKILKLAECGNLSGEGLASLASIKSLECLDLGDTKINDACLNGIENLPRLRVLSLEGTSVTSSGIRLIATLNELRHLDLRCTDIDDDGIKQLKMLPNLRTLLVGSPVAKLDSPRMILDLGASWTYKYTDAGARSITTFSQLNSLSMNCSDAVIPQLISLNHLRGLALFGDKITDASLNDLKRLTQLEELDLCDTKLSKEAFRELQNRLPNTKIQRY